MKKTILSLWLVLCAFAYANSQMPVLSAKQMKEDINVVKNIYIGLAPRLSGIEKKKLDRAYNDAQKKLNKPMDLHSFMNYLFSIKDGSYVDQHAAFVLPEPLVKAMNPKEEFFPLTISIIGRKIFVNADSSELPFGTEILSINGVKTLDVLNRILPESPGTYDIRNVEEFFDAFYYTKYLNPDVFKLQYKLPNTANILNITMRPINALLRNKRYLTKTVQPVGRNRNKLYTYSNFQIYNTAYFQLNSFNCSNDQMKQTMDLLLDTLKAAKTENLIIDLRYNGGGSIFTPDIMYTAIAQKPFVQELSVVTRQFVLPEPQQILYINNIDSVPILGAKRAQDYMDKEKKLFHLEGGSYVFKELPGKTIDTLKNGFKGKVFLLISGNTFSAASYFTALFKSERRGIIIGEAAGGSHHNLTGGNTINYTLPNSKIQIVFPLLFLKLKDSIYAKVPEKNVLPDISINDIERYKYFLGRQDTELMIVKKYLDSVYQK